MLTWVRVAAFFLVFSHVGIGEVEKVCPKELVAVGEKIIAAKGGGPRLATASAKVKGQKTAGGEPAEMDKTAIAREAALFLINTAYPSLSGEESGMLRSGTPAMLLHRNRLRILLGAERKVPLQFLTDLEARSRRTILTGRALEEKLWELERLKGKDEPKFQPETVRQTVTVITKVLERKEVKPISDFVLDHYQDALSIMGVSNQVDELRWKIIAIMMQEKLDQDAEAAKPGPEGTRAVWTARFRSWGHSVRALWFRTPQWEVAAKDLLMALASSDHQPLEPSTVKMLQRFASAIRDPERYERYTLQLNSLLQIERDLAESLTSYYRHYRSAGLLKKILHDMACSDGREPLESYSLARQAMAWRLDDHPYVRHVVETGLMGATSVFHPYLCVALPLARPVNEIDEPILAAQALGPEILSALFQESMRVGLEAMVREWNVAEADKTLAEVESLLKKSAAGVGAKVLTSAAAHDPVYEKMIGPALAPIVERLKKMAGPGSAPPSTVQAIDGPYDPWADDTKDKDKDKDKEKKKKKDEDPLDPWFEAEEGRGTSRRRDKDKVLPALETEPVAYLLQRIEDYLGEEATKIPWADVRKVALQPQKPEGQKERKPEDGWGDDDFSSFSRRNRDREVNFAISYAWVDSVYELLNKRAEALRERDNAIELMTETEKLRAAGNGDPLAKEREEVAIARQALIETFLNVQHGIEACIIGQQGLRNREANDEQISTDALRVASYYLTKHRALARFLTNHANSDPSLRHLWVRSFLRVAGSHLDLNPRNPYPSPVLPPPVTAPITRWLRIAGLSCGIVAMTIGGSAVLSMKGCGGPASSAPPAVKKEDPGKPKVETPAKQPPKPFEDPWGEPGN